MVIVLTLHSAYAELEVVTVELVRGPGSYGNVSARLTTTDRTARLGVEYFTDGVQPLSVWFADSIGSSQLNITLTNDGLVHPAKQFTVHLTAATGIQCNLIYT